MLIPVILSGGAGARLWPVSREGHPKPFMKLADGQSLLHKTYRRAAAVAKVVNGERDIFVNTNELTYIPAGHQHRLENPGLLELVMIEVQSGEYLGEDDIVRFQDHYGRT
jgi:mannose-1-phosphate guanylyltransferase